MNIGFARLFRNRPLRGPQGLRIGALAGLVVVGLAARILPAAAQTISVDWSAPAVGQTTPNLFGSNDQQCGNFSAGALDPAYAKDMSQIGVHFIRLHSATVEQWTTNGAWDPTKVRTALDAPYVRACGDSHLIITIDDVSSWCRNADNSINDSEYAAFCAQLVRIVNRKLARKVLYWECMNEPDSWSDYANNNWAPMFALYNQCAAAMKAVDPNVEVGGPTMSWYDDTLAKQFLSACWANVGFLSWHAYMVGDNCTPPRDGPTIYSDVMQHMGMLDSAVVDANADIAAQETIGVDEHAVPTVFDEFNIPDSWWLTGWGQTGNVGAAFFASVLTHMADDGLDIGANWSAKDDTYGLLTMQDQFTLPAYVYQMANHMLVGTIEACTDSSQSVECLPIYRGPDAAGDKHAFLVTNTYYLAQRVTIADGLPAGETARLEFVDAAGVTRAQRVVSGSTLSVGLQPFSVLLVTMP